ncbi:hypothetical protein D1164_23130 [Mariniphaga sediminis]|uniref:Uncharacterized protein n=1 Tax=Mariniphaga sediminis TaxID=1628158 RepID=A0A399CT13_9BACT|nr:hypothetical protein D1164_23130 [Mariniphaga sediminis]
MGFTLKLFKNRENIISYKMNLSFIAQSIILKINLFYPDPKGSKFLPDVRLGFSVRPSGIGVKLKIKAI